MAKIKRDDEVIILAGKDKGKRGKVRKVLDNGKVIVSKELKDNAGEGKRLVRNIYWDPDLPKKVVSGNLPLGQGYQRWGRFTEIFHGKGSTING